MSRRGICDGCGMLGPVVLGVCSMCRADGVPQRQTAAEVRAEIAAVVMCKTPDSFPTLKRERARVAALRAEEAEQERRDEQERPARAAANEQIAREAEAAFLAKSDERLRKWREAREADR